MSFGSHDDDLAARSPMTWLRDPQSVVPNNAMPDLGLNEQQARDIAAYLYTLD